MLVVYIGAVCKFPVRFARIRHRASLLESKRMANPVVLKALSFELKVLIDASLYFVFMSGQGLIDASFDFVFTFAGFGFNF